MLPYYVRQTSANNQLVIPKEFMACLVGNKKATFKITLNKSQRKLNLELI